MKTALTYVATATALVLTLASMAIAGIPNTFPQNVGFPTDTTSTQPDTTTKSGASDK